MLSEASGSSTLAARRDKQQQAPSKSPAPVALLPTSEKEPPAYGAQHRQDALWEGGNDTLPPLWHHLCQPTFAGSATSASHDCSIRIWDLKTNQAVGDPLLHDDHVYAVAMSPDGKCIASAGLDKKNYIWSLEAALKRHQGEDDNNAKLKGLPAQPRVIIDVH
ncbi:hypothetical protein P692DRAFT_201254584 [Suillus brevipes Sb2]|nr:hypothetical protein P692DRAFT_201254584 [Suillus brevipes Sb2]